MTTIPLHKRLTFRIALIIFAALVVFDSLTVPLWNRLSELLHPEWGDPSYLRAYADSLEGIPHAYEAAFESSSTSLAKATGLYGAIVAYGAICASILAIFVSHLATRRIRRLTDQIARKASQETTRKAPQETHLPGPFAIDGEDEIHLLATTMNDMRNRIGRLIEQRSEWISGVSHDLRAPLTALSASVDRSHSMLAALPEGSQRDAFVQLWSAARLDVKRLKHLTEDLVEMARLETGTDLLVEPVPPVEFLRDAVQALEPLAEELSVTLELVCPQGLPELQADGRRLIRALENLIVNSLRYASRGVIVSARQAGDEFQVSVEDDGPGLPEIDGSITLEALGPDRARDDSTGMGIKVASKIIAAHGGRLVAENRPESGAVVHVYLPALGETR